MAPTDSGRGNASAGETARSKTCCHFNRGAGNNGPRRYQSIAGDEQWTSRRNYFTESHTPVAANPGRTPGVIMNSEQQVHEQLPDASVERSDAVMSTETFARKQPADPAEPNVDVAIPAIEFRNVNFSYEDKKVLDDLSFQLARGEIKIILSGSGGGKSTILKLVLGLLKPDAGQIFFDGEEITEFDETELQRVRDKIGMVFQEGALFDSLTVYENVAYRLQDRGVPEEGVEEEVRALLKFVKLEQEMDRLPSELSGGMR